MERYFLSRDNVDRIYSKFKKKVKIRSSPAATEAAKEFIKDQMKLVYRKKGKDKPSGMRSRQFLEVLNQMSFKLAVKQYIDMSNNRKRRDTSVGDYKLNRDRETRRGGRRMDPRSRDQVRDQRRSSGRSSAPPYSSDASSMGGGFASFRTPKSFDDNQGGKFISATGEVMSGMSFDNNGTVSVPTDRRSSGGPDRRDPRYNQQRGDNRYNRQMQQGRGYDPRYTNDGTGGRDELSALAAQRAQEYQGMSHRQMPPKEINFCVDGGDTRKQSNFMPGSGGMSGMGGMPGMPNMGMGMMTNGLDPSMALMMGLDGGNFEGFGNTMGNSMGTMNGFGDPSMMGGFSDSGAGPGMSNPGMGMSNGMSSGPMGDLDRKVSQALAERSSMDRSMGQQPRGKFDPTVSPYANKPSPPQVPQYNPNPYQANPGNNPGKNPYNKYNQGYNQRFNQGYNPNPQTGGKPDNFNMNNMSFDQMMMMQKMMKNKSLNHNGGETITNNMGMGTSLSLEELTNKVYALREHLVEDQIAIPNIDQETLKQMSSDEVQVVIDDLQKSIMKRNDLDDIVEKHQIKKNKNKKKQREESEDEQSIDNNSSSSNKEIEMEKEQLIQIAYELQQKEEELARREKKLNKKKKKKDKKKKDKKKKKNKDKYKSDSDSDSVNQLIVNDSDDSDSDNSEVQLVVTKKGKKGKKEKKERKNKKESFSAITADKEIGDDEIKFGKSLMNITFIPPDPFRQVTTTAALDYKKSIKEQQEKEQLEKQLKDKLEKEQQEKQLKDTFEKEQLEKQLEKESNKEDLVDDKSVSSLEFDYTDDNSVTSLPEVQYELHDIKIDPMKYAESDNYNDYTVSLPEALKNVNRIELVSADIPRGDNNITNCNNIFSYRINNKIETIEIDEDDYGIDDLLEVLKDELDSLGDSIEISMDDDKVTISNSNNDSFDILVVPRSINQVLGFTKKSYYGKSSYTGEVDYNIDADHQVYLYMEDSSDNPFTELKLGKTHENIIKEVNIPSLNKLHIRFKVNNNPKDNTLYNFNGNSHSLHLKVNSEV